jgi:hypothetical protein
MPAKPAWLLRIPEILDDLQSLAEPVIDRCMCERLFRVRRRRAITLMQEFGARQSGRTLLLERTAMVHKLEALQQGQEFESERDRKRKLRDGLDELHRHRAARKVRIPVLAPELRKQLPELPCGVHVRDRELAIEYANVEQLLQRLYELSQAAAIDFEAFTTVIETPAGTAEVTQSRPKSPV